MDIVQSICYAAWIGEYLLMDLATLLGDCTGKGGTSCSWIIRDTDISVLDCFFSSKVWGPGKTLVILGFRVTIGHLRVTIGHPSITIGHLRVTISYFRITLARLMDS